MPDDVRDALERFQTFLDGHSGEMVDKKSNFTVSDGRLLAGEIAMAAAHSADRDEDPFD